VAVYDVVAPIGIILAIFNAMASSLDKIVQSAGIANPSAMPARVRLQKRLGFSSYLSRKRVPNLDGLRGLAILLVLAHHVPTSSVDWVVRFQHHGSHGVSLFFVISGYIVMTLMLRELRKSGGIDVRGFLVRRILRLWPLYYLVLLVEAGLVYVAQVYSPENQALFTDNLACYVMYCSNWLKTSGQGPFFVSWSLAVEEQFYLLLSLLLLVLRPALLAAVFMVLLVVKVSLASWVHVDMLALPWRVILSYSEAILLGVLLAFLLNNSKSYVWLSRFAAYRYMPAVLFVMFGGFLLFANLENKSGVTALVFYLICTLLVGVCAISDKLPIIGGKMLSWIGLLSYGIYLLHMPILSAVKKFTMEPMLVLIFTLVLVLPLAWLSYTFFEEPLRQWGRTRTRPVKTGQTVPSVSG